MEGRSEDSIVLLYRPNSESYWQIETNMVRTIGAKNDKRGSIKINELKKGEYTFGVMGKEITNSFFLDEKQDLNIFPNPADKTLKLEWAISVEPQTIEIYNSLGQNIFSKKVRKNSKSETLSIKNSS